MLYKEFHNLVITLQQPCDTGYTVSKISVSKGDIVAKTLKNNSVNVVVPILFFLYGRAERMIECFEFGTQF